jgi:hypothetical protein
MTVHSRRILSVTSEPGHKDRWLPGCARRHDPPGIAMTGPMPAATWPASRAEPRGDSGVLNGARTTSRAAVGDLFIVVARTVPGSPWARSVCGREGACPASGGAATALDRYARPGHFSLLTTSSAGLQRARRPERGFEYIPGTGRGTIAEQPPAGQRSQVLSTSLEYVKNGARSETDGTFQNTRFAGRCGNWMPRGLLDSVCSKTQRGCVDGEPRGDAAGVGT